MDDNLIIELFRKRDETAIAELQRKYDKLCFYIARQYRFEDHGGMQVPMFSILTREAAGIVRDIHNRMPIILGKEDVKEWIRP